MKMMFGADVSAARVPVLPSMPRRAARAKECLFIGSASMGWEKLAALIASL
jgi:hypothetical protein